MSAKPDPFAHMLTYTEVYENNEADEAGWDDPDAGWDDPDAARVAHATSDLLPTDAESSWSEPVPLPGEATRPPYPIDSMRGVIRAAAEAATAQVDAPVDLGACIALGCLSAAVVGAVEAEVVAVESGGRGWREPAALYVCGVAQSGEGKTPLVTFLRAPLEDVQRERQVAAGPSIAAAAAELEVLRGQRDAAKRAASKREISSADLANVIETVARAEAEQPGEPRLLAYDITPEKLADLAGANAGRLGVISDEGAELLELTGRYQSKTPNYGPLIAGWDGTSYTRDRVTQPTIHVDHLTLAVALMIQPMAVRRLLAADENARDRGLAARFLFAWPESRIGFRSVKACSVPPSVEWAWSKLIHDLAAEAHRTKPAIVLSLSTEATAEFYAWSERHEASLQPHVGYLAGIQDLGAKLRSQALRLALLLHLADTSGMRGAISGETMRRAMRLADYHAAHALALFADAGADDKTRDAKLILDWLRARPATVVTTQDLARSKGWPPDRVHDAFEVLAEYRWTHRAAREKGKRGRPSETWWIHPMILESNPRESAKYHGGTEYSRVSAGNSQDSVGDAHPMPSHGDDDLDASNTRRDRTLQPDDGRCLNCRAGFDTAAGVIASKREAGLCVDCAGGVA